MELVRSCVMCCVLAVSMFAGGVQANEVTLKLLNWEEYMDPELLAEFHAESGVAVSEVHYESDDERDELLIQGGGEGFDLILVSGLMLERYVRNGWLSALPTEVKSQLSVIDERWWEAFPAAELYAVPYFWGTLGIAYRSDLITQPIDSWLQFFKPAQELRGRLGVLPSIRETTAMALKALGYSLNTRKGRAYREAMALVEKQVPYVKSYGFPDLNETAKLVTGEVSAAMIYSGDALALQEFNEHIEYVLPKEGGNIWVDYLTVSSRSAHKEAAWAFIEFINRPKNAARQAEFVYYASPNKAATALMTEEFLSDTTINPSVGALKKSEFFQKMLPRRMKELDETFEALIN